MKGEHDMGVLRALAIVAVPIVVMVMVMLANG